MLQGEIGCLRGEPSLEVTHLVPGELHGQLFTASPLNATITAAGKSQHGVTRGKGQQGLPVLLTPDPHVPLCTWPSAHCDNDRTTPLGSQVSPGMGLHHVMSPSQITVHAHPRCPAEIGQ